MKIIIKNRSEFLERLIFPIGIVAILWMIEISKQLFYLSLGQYGLYPRDISGLRGILFSPFIHSDFPHLISNSIPLLVLLCLLFVFYKKVAYRALGSIYILTGVLVWIFGRNTSYVGGPLYHVGASGVVYGLVAFIFWIGVFTKNRISIVLSLIMVFVYGSMFLGIAPGEDGISWESHLLGGVAGIIVAFLFRNKVIAYYREEKLVDQPFEEEEYEGEYFLPRDIFDNNEEDLIADEE